MKQNRLYLVTGPDPLGPDLRVYVFAPDAGTAEARANQEWAQYDVQATRCELLATEGTYGKPASILL